MKCPKCGNSTEKIKGKQVPSRDIIKRKCLNNVSCNFKFYLERIDGKLKQIDEPQGNYKHPGISSHDGKSVQKRISMGFEEAAAQINIALFGNSKFYPWRKA